MNNALVVARKEIKELLSNRTTLLFEVGFTLFFTISYALGISQSNNASRLDSAIFYISLSLALFISYVSVGQVFLREKVDGVIETLICAPISLRQIWLGKVIGVTAPAYVMSLLSAVLMIAVPYIRSGMLLVPGGAALVHIFIVVPLLIASFSGAVGFAELLLGMRENRILNFLLFAPAFAALYGLGTTLAGNTVISWLIIAILLVAGIIIFSVITFLTRYLDKERIVTTLS